MPSYLYECPKCGQNIELVQSIREKCAPVCVASGCDGHIIMETVIQKSSFVLKGSRWAHDGYSGS